MVGMTASVWKPSRSLVTVKNRIVPRGAKIAWSRTIFEVMAAALNAQASSDRKAVWLRSRSCVEGGEVKALRT